MLTVVWVFFYIAYSLVLVHLVRCWKQLPSATLHDHSELEISLIIPFRNEAERLPRLLESLSTQQYKHLEIIFIDDYSTDHSVGIIDEFIAAAPLDCRLINNQNQGKKWAITTGIQAARGKIILTTDADCVLGASIPIIVASTFENEACHLAFGAVGFKQTDQLVEKLQQIEFASLMAVNASMAASGSPLTGSAAFMAFRKSSFETVGGFEGNFDIPSGDDEFLIRKIKSAFPDGITFIKHPNARVTTEYIKSWRDFYHQRVRWAGKWRQSSHGKERWAGPAVFLFHLVSLAGITGLLFDSISIYWVLGGLLSRAFFEYQLIHGYLRFYSVRVSFLHVLCLSLIYSLYAIFFGIAANINQYDWKGRRYHAHDR
ncbi:glycosyltransferase [Penaeicola halotolerans]|uniref:glycosyltransferase n=1 Tax=Penaeicola halotolerans TaxID=2793196 RepID=UPI001CF85D57|nr:glycosyltransferase [Penaeicola halotolerans]